MRQMAVERILLDELVVPFEDPSVRTDLRFGQLPDDYPCLLDQTFVIAIEVVHILRGKDEVVEQVADDGGGVLACLRDGRWLPVDQEAVFRRSGRRRDEALFGVRQEIHAKSGTFLHDRPDAGQIRAILIEQVLVEQVPAHPRLSERPERPHRIAVRRQGPAPDIHVVEHRRSTLGF